VLCHVDRLPISRALPESSNIKRLHWQSFTRAHFDPQRLFGVVATWPSISTIAGIVSYECATSSRFRSGGPSNANPRGAASRSWRAITFGHPLAIAAGQVAWHSTNPNGGTFLDRFVSAMTLASFKH
jgi:hypothetical protein